MNAHPEAEAPIASATRMDAAYRDRVLTKPSRNGRPADGVIQAVKRFEFSLAAALTPDG